MGEVIRKMKGGRFVGWYLRYVDADGRRKQRASKQPTHTEARRMLIEIEARIVRGLVGMEERHRDSTTLEALFARFSTEYRNPRCKDIAAYRRRVTILLRRVSKAAPHLAKLEISSLQSTHISRLREVLLARHPAGTVRTTLSTVAAVLAWAVREGWLEKNPAVGVARPPSPDSRVDFLSADEVRKLLAEVQQRARTTSGTSSLSWWSRWVAITIGIHTGARKGEIFGLRWSELDLDGQRLTISRSYATTPKSGKTRHLRLPSAIVPLLREWRERCPRSELVCPVYSSGVWSMSRDASAEHGLPQLLQAAGCRVLSRPWHLLRHTFASHFVQSGGSLLALSQILGHSDVKVTMVYAHLSPEFMAGQIERVKF